MSNTLKFISLFVIPQRLMVIEAPCRSASLHGNAQKNFKAARPWAALAPIGARLPTAIILCGFAAYQSVPKVCIGGNATNCSMAVEYRSLRHYPFSSEGAWFAGGIMAEHDVWFASDFVADEIDHRLSIDEKTVSKPLGEASVDEFIVEFAELLAACGIFGDELHHAVGGEGVASPTFAERNVVVWDARGDFGVVQH